MVKKHRNLSTFLCKIWDEKRPWNGANKRHFIFAPLPPHRTIIFCFSATATCATFFSSRRLRGGAKSGASVQHWIIVWHFTVSYAVLLEMFISRLYVKWFQLRLYQIGYVGNPSSQVKQLGPQLALGWVTNDHAVATNIVKSQERRKGASIIWFRGKQNYFRSL